MDTNYDIILALLGILNNYTVNEIAKVDTKFTVLCNFAKAYFPFLPELTKYDRKQVKYCNGHREQFPCCV